MKNLVLLFAIASLITFSSCGEDEDVFADNSSVTLNIDGTTYNKEENFAVSFSQITFNDEETFQINGSVVNGTDTVGFSLSLPSFNTGTYTKANNTDEVKLSISFTEAFSSYSTDPFIFDDIDTSVIDYEINITTSNDENVSGNFDSILMNSDGETVEVSGEFVSIDGLAALGGLFN
ncbi:hypothetical protein [Ekhidna sp.]